MNNGETLSIRQLTSCVGMIKKPVYRWLVLGRTDRASLQREMGEKKRRLFERSEFLRFRRKPLRSRPQTEAGVFSFCYLFLLDAQKKK